MPTSVRTIGEAEASAAPLSAGRDLRHASVPFAARAAPPLLVGAVKPKTLQLSTELADGVILTGDTTPDALRDAAGPLQLGRDISGRPANEVTVFVTVTDRAPADEVANRVREFVGAGATTVALHAIGDDPYPVPEFARFVADDVRAALDLV